MRALVAAVSLLVLASPALGQGGVNLNRDRGSTAQTPSDSRRTGDLNENGERLICRTAPTSSTSRMSARRVCHTEAEWRAIQRASN
jgi:hypothetical protein